MADMIRVCASLDDPLAAKAAMSDLQKGQEGSSEFRPYTEPVLSLMPVVELRAQARAAQEGQPNGVDQMVAAMSTAVPDLVPVFANPRDCLANPVPEGVDPDDLPPELHDLVQNTAAPLNAAPPVASRRALPRNWAKWSTSPPEDADEYLEDVVVRQDCGFKDGGVSRWR
jgi:hypothetical protein